MSERSIVHGAALAELSGGARVLIRPLEAGDADAFQGFVRHLSPASRRHRFHSPLRALPQRLLTDLTRLDPQRHRAWIAEPDGEAPAIVAEVRYATGETREAEFAIAVAEGWRRRGLGRLLLATLEARARSAGLTRLFGDVLAGNHEMMSFAARFGFRKEALATERGCVRVIKSLRATS